MQFNHDNMTGVQLASELVNLLADGDWKASRVEEVLNNHAIRWSAVDDGTTGALRRWTVRLRAVFVAENAEIRCRAVNSLLVDGVDGVYLTTHDGLRPHLHFAPDENDIVGRVTAVTAGGLALFTVEAGGLRLGECSAHRCNRVFVDTSRNGRRAYCSTRCANGDAVARHRRRQRI